MTNLEKYDEFFNSIGISDAARKENLLGSLFQLAKIILTAKEDEE